MDMGIDIYARRAREIQKRDDRIKQLEELAQRIVDRGWWGSCPEPSNWPALRAEELDVDTEMAHKLLGMELE